MEYICKLSGSPSWIGKIGLIEWNETQVELDICGRGTQFHIIIGKHQTFFLKSLNPSASEIE